MFENGKKAFKDAYTSPGGATSFWCIVGGCIFSLIAPRYFAGTSFASISGFIGAASVILGGSKFFQLLALYNNYYYQLSEKEKKKK